MVGTAGVPSDRWQQQEAYQPDENVAPGHTTPVLKLGKDGLPELHTMTWGLVPSFTKKDTKPDHFRMVGFAVKSLVVHAGYQVQCAYSSRICACAVPVHTPRLLLQPFDTAMPTAVQCQERYAGREVHLLPPPEGQALLRAAPGLL